MHYSGRFAAKESIKKAIISIYPNIMISFKNINIRRNKFGKPYVNIVDFNIKEIEYIHLTISHTKEYAIAHALLKKNDCNNI